MKNRNLAKLIFIILALFILSCRHKPSKSNGVANEDVDFNPTSISWFSEKRPVIATEEGLYYISGNWLYYSDLKSGKAHPLCFKVGCRHENEEVLSKCDAYVGTNPNHPGEIMFLGSYHGKLYVRVLDDQREHLQLIEMELDGSDRHVIIKDTQNIDSNSMLFHKGYFYFTTNEQNSSGEFVQQIRRVSIDKISGSSEVLVEISRNERNFYSFRPIFPLNDSLYYIELSSNDTAHADLFRYDLQAHKEYKIAESQALQIYGGIGNILILFGADGKHLEYSPETDEFTESSWLNLLHERHPEWYNCQAGCINDDFALYFVIEESTSDNLVLNPDLIVVNRQGEELCEIPSSAHGWTSPQVLAIKGEKYLVIYGPDYGPNNTLDLYKVSDLMQGKVKPQKIRRE